MNKKQKMICLIAYVFGCLSFSLGSMFRNYLSDFSKGFFEGIAIVGMLVGSAYMVRCLIKKENPYNLK